MADTYRRHQLRHTLITGAGPTVIAAALVGSRVVIYGYALAGAGNTITDSDAVALTGVLPAGSLYAQQPEYLLKSPNDKGASVAGAGTGFVVWAYEKVITVSQNF